jgi:hypothetical protein
MINRFPVHVVVGISSLVLLCSKTAAEDEFRPNYLAEGSVLCKSIGEDGTIEFAQEFFFSIMQDEAGRWRLEIVTTPPQHNQHKYVSRELLSYDGKDIYSVAYCSHRWDRTASGQYGLVPQGPPESAAHGARVSKGPYPIDHGSAVGTIWLAFVGGNYLLSTGQQVRFPNLLVADARNDPAAWICDFQYSLIDGNIRPLLEKGRYLLNKKYLADSPFDYPQLDQPMTEELAARFRNMVNQYKTAGSDILNRATYELDEVESFNGLLVPKKFHALLTLAPIRTNMQGHFYGAVTNLAVPNATTMLPPLLGRITVQDRRVFWKGKGRWRAGVFYDLDDEGWVRSTNHSKVRLALNAAPPSSGGPFAYRRHVHLTTVTLFVIVLLLPVFLVAWRWWRRSRMQPG